MSTETLPDASASPQAPPPVSNKPLLLILTTVALDGMGLGLILPILPKLVETLSGSHRAETHFSVMLALYAAMQFLFSPILGALSDRYGRRPVLLISLAGAAVDYLLMYFAPTMWILYIGRVVAGITGANIAVATAYIADVTREDQRARGYGYMNACFGLGFVAGPVLGGFAGDVDVRLPFLLAALLNAVNLLLGFFFLPESHQNRTQALGMHKMNPFVFFRSLGGFRQIVTLLTVFFMLHFIGQIGASLWIIYTQDRYLWTPRMVGWSFAAFGVLHAATQAFLTGPVTKRLGEGPTLLLGMFADGIGYIAMAFATQGWMVFAIIPLLSSGGIAMPALQTLLSRQVSENEQGELQGILVSLMSVAAIIGPLIFAQLYAFTHGWWFGTVWIVGAGMYVLCMPVMAQLLRQLKTRSAPQP
jgi:DHA1 family tetracycline resistance protein-like MFS transporter